MLLKIYPENPNQRAIDRVVECLNDDGVIIYPTDTIYGIGCDIFKPKSIERITDMLGDRKKKSAMTFICSDLSHLSDYAKPISNPIFKTMKKVLPGPFTFILEANGNVPKLLQSNKKSVGIRVPDNNIIREIVRQLGHPILSTSVKDDDEVVEYTTDPANTTDEHFGAGWNEPGLTVNFLDTLPNKCMKTDRGPYSLPLNSEKRGNASAWHIRTSFLAFLAFSNRYVTVSVVML